MLSLHSLIQGLDNLPDVQAARLFVVEGQQQEYLTWNWMSSLFCDSLFWLEGLLEM